MAAEPLPWVARLAAKLGVEDAIGIVPPPPPPAPAPIVSERQARAMELSETAGKLVDAARTPIAILRAAAHEIRLPGGEAAVVPPQLARYVPAFAKLLREQREAAELVSTVLLRHGEAEAELAGLRQALARGTLEHLDLERAKGRFFYLAKLAHYFQPYPMLHQLFAAQARPANVTRPLVAQALPALTGRGRGEALEIKHGADSFVSSAGGFPSSAGSAPLPRHGGDRLSLPSSTAAAGSTPAEQGRRLVAALAPKLDVLRAACEDNPSLVPPSLQATLRGVSAALAAQPALQAQVRELLGQFQLARRVLSAGTSTTDPAFLRALSALRDAPRRFKDHPALAALLAP